MGRKRQSGESRPASYTSKTNAVKETPTLRKPPSAFEDSIRRDQLPVWPDDAEERIAPTQRLSEVCPFSKSVDHAG